MFFKKEEEIKIAFAAVHAYSKCYFFVWEWSNTNGNIKNVFAWLLQCDIHAKYRNYEDIFANKLTNKSNEKKWLKNITKWNIIAQRWRARRNNKAVYFRSDETHLTIIKRKMNINH